MHSTEFDLESERGNRDRGNAKLPRPLPSITLYRTPGILSERNRVLHLMAVFPELPLQLAE